MAKELSRRRAIYVAGSLLAAGCAPDERQNNRTAKPDESNPVSGVAEAWDRIHKWLSIHAPKILGSLNPPASDAQIAEAEKAFGLAMPEEWRQLYQVHNGMDLDSNQGSLFYGMNFFTLGRAILELGLSDESEAKPLHVEAADPGIRTVDMYNRKWIAFAHDFGDALLCVDMDPAPSGHIGQVIFTDHDNDVAILLSQSVGQLLWQFVGDLEADRYFLNKEGLEDGEQFLSCVPEIDVVNWFHSSRWKHLRIMRRR